MASEESPNLFHGNLDSHNNEVIEPKATPKEIEKIEEEKLKSRFNPRPVTGHSAFLQKRLAKGQKYFDSGDYQMAKQKGPAKIAAAIPPTNLGHPTGDAIPTPESVPTRKTSIIQSKLASPAT
nr:EOG090X0P2R [Polyphemus pediculus]